jgi:uridine kinase
MTGAGTWLRWSVDASTGSPAIATAVVLGVAGGSGSGKTTVVDAIIDRVGADRIAVLRHDAYYRDLSHLPMEQRRTTNLDHPDAFDDELFTAHLDALARGGAVEVPGYDYATYARTGEPTRVEPRPVVLAEGILLFASESLRQRMDVKVYVDADGDQRLLRRLRRDIVERGRTVDSVLDQYEATVRPMHLEFVEPSKRHADVIIPRGGRNTVAIDMVVARVEALLVVSPR